jgi:hypothetical protein
LMHRVLAQLIIIRRLAVDLGTPRLCLYTVAC